MIPYTIRTVHPDDAEALIAYSRILADEPHNGVNFASSADVTFTIEEEREIIQGFLDDPSSQWLVAVDAQGRLIGNSNVRPGRRVFRHTVGLGISIAKEWRNQGLGTTLMREMIAWCTAHPQIHRLELEVFTENSRAIHVYEKLGFEREGIRRQAALKDGHFRDLIMMTMLFPRPNLEG